MKFLRNILFLAGLPFLAAGNECPPPCHASPTATTSVDPHQPAAPTHTIIVGGGTDLIFNPPYLNYVAPGTILRFDFLGRNHTLTESSLYSPCTKLQPGQAVDTGFANFNPNDIAGLKVFDLKVTSFDPRFFYCKQANGTPNGHCLKGMVFAINVCGQTFREFQTKAMKSPPMIRGMKRTELPE